MADIDSPKFTKKHDVKPPPSIAPATEVLPTKVGVIAEGVSTELPPSPDIEDLGTYIDTQQANIKKSVMNLSDPQNRALFLDSWRRIRQVASVAIGYTPTMECPAHPNNAIKLLPAVHGIIKIAPLVEDEAKLALDSIDVKQLGTDGDFLTFIRAIKEADAPFERALDVVEAQTEQSLDARVRLANSRGGQMMQHHFELNQGWIPVRQYLAGAAAEGLETKKKLSGAGALEQDPPGQAAGGQAAGGVTTPGGQAAGGATGAATGTTTPGTGTTTIPSVPAPAPLKKTRSGKKRT